MIEQLKAQQLQLLAKKTLLTDEIAQVDKALGQIGAILQFNEQLAKEAPKAPEAAPE